MSKVVLYDYWRSSASYRVRIALNLAGIPYETIAVDLLAGSHKSPEYLAINPQGLVPTLIIDERTLTQSLAIVEYIAESHSGCGLLPESPTERQRVRALSYAVAMEIHPICNMHVAAHVVDLLGKPEAREEWMRHFILDGLRKVNAMLSENPSQFCCGERPTMADLCLIPQIYNARRWGLNLDALRRITEVDVRCAALAAFQQAHPDRAARPSGH